MAYTLVIVALAALLATVCFSQSHRWLRSLGAVAIALLLMFGNPLSAMASPYLGALGASDESATPEQKALEENLKSSPSGAQYQGIEYAPASRNKLSDAQIERKIKDIHGGLSLSVSSGSVRVSGRVEDKETARNVVEQIKGIPGVHEVTFDLGYEGT